MKKYFFAFALQITPAVSLALVQPALAATAASQLGDLSSFKTIAADTLALVTKGDLPAAKKRITDFEAAWDKQEPALYPMNRDQWGVIDDAADAAIGALRRSNPDASEAEQAVGGLINVLDDPTAH